MFFLLLIVLWQVLYLLFVDVFKVWKPYSAPSPAGVWSTFVNLLKSGVLLSALLKSLGRGGAGFALSVFAGLILGVLIHHFPYLNRNLKPVIMGMQTLPSICWVPFAILWFGLNNSAILFVVVMGSAFSVALAVDDGIKSVPPLYIKAAKTMGAGQRDLYLKVILPACVPSFIAALKQGWSFAWRALMSGEVMSSTVGLGQTLIIGRDMADINQVMLVMLVIIAAGVLIDKCIFTALENRVLRKRGLM
ncbi:MAG: ABC transporter permease [Lachnospiraceae bacterium]|nr:ABC transporter permease [Lachnospiraceae bacterium]MDE6982172.1 ABC transporter permease [Lachnospiraceae bacterium]